MPKRAYSLFLILLFLLPLIAFAQGAPPQINAALNDLGGRVGHPVALSDLISWQWEQDSFPDSSLGCPQPGQAYAQVITVGYKFNLTYNATVYDYRVSADSSAVVLCGTTPAGSATATPIPAAGKGGYVPPCPSPEADKVYMRTRLVAGIQARVVPGLPNNLRAEPNSTSALLSQIAGGSIFDVLAGPQCGEGLLWWQIDVDGQKGWTVEGRDGTYWIEPLLPAALPATRTPISASNADGLSEIARLEGNFDGELAFSPDGATLAVLGAAGSDGVWLYKMASLQDPPRILPGDTLLTSLTFRPDGSQVLVGGSDGAVRLWNTGINETRVEALMLQTHASDIGAVAFAPSGAQFASVGTNALTTAQVDKSNAILLWDANNVSQQAALAGHTARVNALAYSRDGSRLISAGADKTLRIWDVAAKNALTTIQSQSPIRAAAYSPNGQFIAYGAEDGTVALLNAANGQTLSTLRGHTAAVNAVAFSPDNSLLVSVGDDGLVVVWSTQSDKALAILQGHTDKVTGVAFLPDGTLIASIGKDHTVRLWGVQQSVG